MAKVLTANAERRLAKSLNAGERRPVNKLRPKVRPFRSRSGGAGLSKETIARYAGDCCAKCKKYGSPRSSTYATDYNISGLFSAFSGAYPSPGTVRVVTYNEDEDRWESDTFEAQDPDTYGTKTYVLWLEVTGTAIGEAVVTLYEYEAAEDEEDPPTLTEVATWVNEVPFLPLCGSNFWRQTDRPECRLCVSVKESRGDCGGLSLPLAYRVTLNNPPFITSRPISTGPAGYYWTTQPEEWQEICDKAIGFLNNLIMSTFTATVPLMVGTQCRWKGEDQTFSYNYFALGSYKLYHPNDLLRDYRLRYVQSTVSGANRYVSASVSTIGGTSTFGAVLANNIVARIEYYNPPTSSWVQALDIPEISHFLAGQIGGGSYSGAQTLPGLSPRFEFPLTVPVTFSGQTGVKNHTWGPGLNYSVTHPETMSFTIESLS